MTVTADRIAFTPAQVKARVQAWIDERLLPSGHVRTADETDHVVFVWVPDPGSVAVWAAALGQDLELLDTHISTVRCHPVELEGWALAVFCERPFVPGPMRIPTVEAGAL